MCTDAHTSIIKNIYMLPPSSTFVECSNFLNGNQVYKFIYKQKKAVFGN